LLAGPVPEAKQSGCGVDSNAAKQELLADPPVTPSLSIPGSEKNQSQHASTNRSAYMSR